MPDGLIGSDGLDGAQSRMLDALADMIIPASADGAKPSAAEVGVLGYIRKAEPDALPAIAADLKRLAAAAEERHGAAFADLPPDARQALVDAVRKDEPGFLRALAVLTATCYYQDDRVLEAIGLEPRPPFPAGYEVPVGDFSLLEPVKRRGNLVREA